MRTDLHGLLTRALRALRHEPRTKNQWTRKQAIERAQARQDLFCAIGDLETEMRAADSCPLCRELSIECLCTRGVCAVFTMDVQGANHDGMCAMCGLSYEAHSKFAGAR